MIYDLVRTTDHDDIMNEFMNAWTFVSSQLFDGRHWNIGSNPWMGTQVCSGQI